MTIDKQTLQAFRIDFKEAMKELETKYNITVNLGNISYTNREFSGKINCYSNDENAKNTVNNMLKADGAKFKLGDKFVYKNAEFEIVSVDYKKRRMPVVLKNTQTGNNANASIDFVNSFFNNSAN
ncbi:MAG: hypothetical protein MJ224_00205 [archaeon]|nr:hypothetical protein [archaeon]